MSRLQKFHMRYQTFKNLIEGFQRTTKSRDQTLFPRDNEIQAWARCKAEGILHEVQSVVREDGICLADMPVNLPGGKSIRELVSINLGKGRDRS